jgi:sulfite reductase (NADPH) flavoprotein alpha-component
MSEPRSASVICGNAAVLATLALAAVLLLRLHQGPWWLAPPLADKWWLAATALVAYAGLCAGIAWRARPRTAAASADPAQIAVVWASQSGFAHDLAERSAAALSEAGQPAYPLPLERVDAALLDSAERMLFIVSTTGEGDPPDNAIAFLRTIMRNGLPLPRLRYGLLALGDRNYGNFCAFGRQLDEWLRHQHAHPLFDRIEVDCADPDALRHWQHLLSQLCDQSLPAPDWSRPHYRHWQLQQRQLLNAGSVGGEVHRLQLRPLASELPHWQAGDIAEIGPRNASERVTRWLHEHQHDGSHIVHGRPLRDWLAESRLPDAGSGGTDPGKLVAQLKPLAHREYSIASIPSEGVLELLVRLHTDQHGAPGIGSGWLCRHAQPGDDIALRIRANPGFHPPQVQTPLILIGNGTGIAGLRAHLRARIAAGARRNWLLFGERNAACDLHYGTELQQWQQQGWIERLDVVFSRDPPLEIRYVQHALRIASATVHDWLAAGAAIYVCGSLRGMAAEIDLTLEELLGADAKEQLLLQGRYRRDVY